MTLRVIFDANIYLSYLLVRNPRNTIASIIESTIESESITILMPPELIREIADRALNKPYFMHRLAPDSIVQVLHRFVTHAVALPELDDNLQHVVRDAKDDYLIAYGLILGANYLVTGDQDLLALKQIRELSIISPTDYLNALKLHSS